VAGRSIRAPDPIDRPPVVAETHDADLEGRHIVISVGGTVEPIDPVRFIGNRSTGKMGVALAQAALDRGARVTLVVGHVSVALPSDDRMLVFQAETTADMGGLVRAAVAEADALIMAAAVADFRPRKTAATKLGRETGLTLELEPTEDILAGVAESVPPLGDPARPILVGFAAETGSLDRAADKLRRKGVDFLVANDVAEEGSGFGTDTNHVWILSADGEHVDLPLRSKRAVADEILDRVAGALDARGAAAQTEPQTQETIA
jgi:phosphopantothenoylcysteine decarboxylase/phosphopantothenate--cysteine ligase